MPNVQVFESPSPEEEAVIQIVEQRIVGAFDDLCTGLEGPAQLAIIDINDFEGPEFFEARLLVVSGIGDQQSRVQRSEEKGEWIRDIWCRGASEGKGTNLFGEDYFQEDEGLLQQVLDTWEEADVDEIDQKYFLWGMILTAAVSAKVNIGKTGLPWIIENGQNDFAPLICAKVLNPNGEAADYLKEVWRVEG